MLAQLGSDLVRKLLRVLGVLWRGDDGRSPAEDGIPPHRDEDAADQQALKDHVFKLGVCFCFLVHRTLFCRRRRTKQLKSDDFAETALIWGPLVSFKPAKILASDPAIHSSRVVSLRAIRRRDT